MTMNSGQVINFDRLLRRREYLFHVEDLRELFTNAAYGEGFQRRQMLLIYKPTTNVAKAQVDFQKIPSTDLMWLKTFRADVRNLAMGIETVASDPFYLPIVFE